MIFRLFERALVRNFVNWKTRSVAIHQHGFLLWRTALLIDSEDALHVATPTLPPKRLFHCVKCGDELNGLRMTDSHGEIHCPKCVFMAAFKQDQNQRQRLSTSCLP